MSSKRDDDKEADITSAYQAMMAAQIYAQNSSISSESRQTNYHVAASQQQYLQQHQPQRDALSHQQAIYTAPVIHHHKSQDGNNLRLIQHSMQQQMQLLAEMRARERWEQQLIPHSHPQPQQIGGQVFNPNYNVDSKLDQMRERIHSQQHAQLKATSDRLQQEINYKMLLESQQRNTSSTQQQHQTQLMRRAQQHNMKRNIPPFDNAIPISTALNSYSRQQHYQHNHSVQSEHKMKVYQLPQHEQYSRQPQQQQQQSYGMNVDTDGASDIQCSSFDSAPPVATALNSPIVDQQIQQQKLYEKEKKKSSTVLARKPATNKKAKQDSREAKVRVKVNNKTCTEGVTVAVKVGKRNTKKMAVAKKRKGKLKKEEEFTDSSESADEDTLVNNNDNKEKDPIKEDDKQLVTFHCRKCNEDCSFPADRSASGKFAMHVRYCKGRKAVKVSPKKKSPLPQKSAVTFHCKFCNKSFTYNARTGAASFTHHTRSCDPNQIAIGKGKKRKKSHEEKMKTPTGNNTTQPTPKKSKSYQAIRAESSYPYAPLGNLWLDKSLSNQSIEDTIVGRRCVWDEGYFVDGHLNPQPQITYDEQKQTQKVKGQCNCGSNHLTNLLNTLIEDAQLNDDKQSSLGRLARRREKSTTASSSSTISSQLAGGKLDPHVSHLLIFAKYIVYLPFFIIFIIRQQTLIQCEEYQLGPEFRLLNNLGTDNVQPFAVRVSPDVVSKSLYTSLLESFTQIDFFFLDISCRPSCTHV